MHGDILYSLLFAKEFAEATEDDISYHLQLYQPAKYTEAHPYGSVMLTQAAADFLTPLLKTVCKDVSISTEVPQGANDLSLFRKLPLNLAAGDIRLWYYQLCDIVLPMDLQRKVIDVEASDVAKGRCILIKTSRYCNAFFKWSELKRWQDRFLFVGLDEEHEAFCKDYFPVERLQVKDALDVAKAIAGASLTIGNPSGLYSIAEMMKAPRCLIAPEVLAYKGALRTGPVNVIPQGGKAVLASTTLKAVYTCEEMLG